MTIIAENKCPWWVLVVFFMLVVMIGMTMWTIFAHPEVEKPSYCEKHLVRVTFEQVHPSLEVIDPVANASYRIDSPGELVVGTTDPEGQIVFAACPKVTYTASIAGHGPVDIFFKNANDFTVVFNR